jgi:hypothetical protein
MISIKRNYEKVQKRSLNLGNYSCLARVVKYRKFSRKSLVKAINELMGKDEYLKSEKNDLIDYLEYLTNLSEEGEKWGKNERSRH